MTRINVKGIVKEYLKKHNYQGLCNVNDCRCGENDLMKCEHSLNECGYIKGNCIPAYEHIYNEERNLKEYCPIKKKNENDCDEECRYFEDCEE